MLKKLLKPTTNRLDNLLSGVGDMALKRRARMIIQGLDLKDGDRVLDAGCGDGYYLYLLSNLRLKLKLTGVDFDQNALQSAKKSLKCKRIYLIQADLMKKLPFSSNSFDKIVMSEVAEHLTDDLEGLKRLYKALKPGGVICITVPNANYPILWDPVNWILERLFNYHIKSGFWAGIWNQHIRLYKKEEIEKLVKKAGFNILESSSYTWWSLPFNHYFINLAARLIYRRGISRNITVALSKFKDKKPTLIQHVFKIINLNDQINNLLSFDNIGVGIFIKASKFEEGNR